MEDFISKVRKFVISKYSPNDYRYHISVVVKNALKLAKIKKADLEIVEIAALLHDTGRAKGVKPSGSKASIHHMTGAKLADEFLSKINYSKDKREKVIGCILAHRGNKEDYMPETLEEKIIYNADAMSHFISFLDLYRNFVEDEGVQKGTELVKEKIDRGWNKKLSMPEAKKLVEKEYRAIKLLLDNLNN